MNSYPTYKDSGIEWLGQIPTHWDLLRNKIFITEHDNVVGQDAYKYTLLSLTKQGVIQRDIESGKGKFPKEFDNYKIVESGNIIFCLFDVDETPRTVGLSSIDGMITGAYNVFSIKGINSQFYYYYFLAVDEAKALRPLYSGLRKVVKTERFAGLRIPVPPEEEQRQIVAYLDYKSNKINERICQRERELQTLSELKQAEIATVVTRGLVPNVPMKESGIEWLGKIPAHWNVKRIASVSHEINDSNVTMEYTQPSQFKFGEIVLKSIIGEGEYDENIKKCTLFKKNDILINGLNLNYDFVTQRVAKSNYDGIITPAYIVIRVKDGLSADYAMFLFKSIDNKKIFNGWGTGIRLTLSYKELKKQCIPIPPKEEQDAIVAYLQSRITFIDPLVELK